jgi:hypothetical protein
VQVDEAWKNRVTRPVDRGAIRGAPGRDGHELPIDDADPLIRKDSRGSGIDQPARVDVDRLRWSGRRKQQRRRSGKRSRK